MSRQRCRTLPPFKNAARPRWVRGLLILIVLSSVWHVPLARAQVPPEFTDLYNSLDTYLTGFNTTLNLLPESGYPVLFAGNLKDADSNAGPQLVNAGAMPGIQLQLQELKAMGVQAVMVVVGFPMLYEPFLTGQGLSYAQFAAFYQQIAGMVRAAGLKLIIENDTLLTNDVQAGWDVAPFYATLDWTQYQQARAQTALTIAQTMQPDYMVVLEEPTTEANNSGQTAANTVTGSTTLLTQILSSVKQSGVPDMLVGAGTGTAQANALSFIQAYVALPVDFIDFHIYPINKSYMPIALQIAATAALAGKPVAMTECWLWKVRDNELGALTTDEIRARDPFSFWAPLDAYFIQTMQNVSQHTRMLFMDPFGSTYFAAYLPYDDSTANLTPSEILNEESAQASQNMQQAMYTTTAMSYYTSLVAPPDTSPPAVPTGVTGVSDNPNTTALNWDASADNVGVAGYYVLRNGSMVGTTANLYYQDSGLTSSTTYTYMIEAFDLAGNVTAPSTPVNVTTADVTPPSTPGNLTATADSCQRLTLAWSASTDNVGIGSYRVFWGISPVALAQVARTPGGITAYTSYPLTAGTTYYYGVEAVDTAGNVSPMSAVVSVTTPMPPAAPAAAAATADSASMVAVSWSAAASGGLPIAHYHVLRGSSASGLSQVAIVAQTSYADRSVTPATTYYYAIEAADAGGDLSPMSVVVSATTPAPPGAPANLVATPESTSRVGLTWSTSVSGGLPIRNYRVYRGATASNLSQVATVLQTSYYDLTVTAGAAYYYAVAASDTDGDLSAMSATVLVTVPFAPQAPSGLEANPVSTTAIGVSWSASVSGGLPIGSYRVFRGASPSSLSQIAIVAKTSYTDKSVSPAVTYYYAVEAVDTGGDVSAMPAPVAATTMALPSAPTSLAATTVAQTYIDLTWTVAQSGMPLARYSIYRGSSPDSLVLLKTIAATKTAFTDYPVAAGTTYYYAVGATDTGGNSSPLSAIIEATTPQ